MENIGLKTIAAMAAGTSFSRRQVTSAMSAKPPSSRRKFTAAIQNKGCGKRVVSSVRFREIQIPIYEGQSTLQVSQPLRKVTRRPMGVPIKSFVSNSVNMICTPLMTERKFLCDVAVENDYADTKKKMGEETRRVFDEMNTALGHGPCAQKAAMIAIELHCTICVEPVCALCKTIRGHSNNDESEDTEMDE